MSIGSRNLGLIIILGILIVLSLSLITYLLIKALIKLYREHKETETLVRKVWDTEARRAAQEETGVKYSPEHMSIVPSLPPLVAHVFSHDKRPVEPYRTFPVPGQQGVRPCMPAAIDALPPAHQPNHHHHHSQSPPPLFLRSGSRSPQQSVPAPPACSQSPPRGLEGGEAPDIPHMVDRDRKPLSPLSADDLERRRKGRRSKAPRTLGKENVAHCVGVVDR